jgi:hypothetical protein
MSGYLFDFEKVLDGDERSSVHQSSVLFFLWCFATNEMNNPITSDCNLTDTTTDRQADSDGFSGSYLS